MTEPIETIVINLNLPGEESIKKVIERYNKETVFLKLNNSAELEELDFPTYEQANETCYIGIIKYPRKSGFSFETTPEEIRRKARATIDYANVRKLIKIERTGNEITKIIQFIN